jgi:hypothetical protein
LLNEKVVTDPKKTKDQPPGLVFLYNEIVSAGEINMILRFARRPRNDDPRCLLCPFVIARLARRIMKYNAYLWQAEAI